MPTATSLRAPPRDGVGQRLREIRTGRGVSQRLLARVIDVSVGTIQNYEHGRVDLTTERIEQLARALNVEPSELLMPPGSELPKYRFVGDRFAMHKMARPDGALDHLAAIWNEIRAELRAERGIDIGDQPARDWIDAIKKRMGFADVSTPTARDAYARIRKRLEWYHEWKERE